MKKLTTEKIKYIRKNYKQLKKIKAAKIRLLHSLREIGYSLFLLSWPIRILLKIIFLNVIIICTFLIVCTVILYLLVEFIEEKCKKKNKNISNTKQNNIIFQEKYNTILN